MWRNYPASNNVPYIAQNSLRKRVTIIKEPNYCEKVGLVRVSLTGKDAPARWTKKEERGRERGTKKRTR